MRFELAASGFEVEVNWFAGKHRFWKGDGQAGEDE